jgi:striatin 1/3/4
LDSISSLAISPDGSTLLSGAQDASVRFWDLSDKTCLLEAHPPHRHRGDEGVLAVAWGEDEVAGSAGADGVVKLYVEQ